MHAGYLMNPNDYQSNHNFEYHNNVSREYPMNDYATIQSTISTALPNSIPTMPSMPSMPSMPYQDYQRNHNQDYHMNPPDYRSFPMNTEYVINPLENLYYSPNDNVYYSTTAAYSDTTANFQSFAPSPYVVVTDNYVFNPTPDIQYINPNPHFQPNRPDSRFHRNF